ncbi:MAG: hypothetical protein U5K54_22700 [Cytophagales bacterium]|nr:hypothetical protein [Cytophagales bacterium]
MVANRTIVSLCRIKFLHKQSLLTACNACVALQKHDTIELTALNGLVNECLRLDLQKAKKTTLKTIATANPTIHARWISVGYNYLTTIYRELGLPDSSQYYIQQSEKLVREHPDQYMMRFNLNQSASLFYKNMGDYKKSLALYAGKCAHL